MRLCCGCPVVRCAGREPCCPPPWRAALSAASTSWTSTATLSVSGPGTLHVPLVAVCGRMPPVSSHARVHPWVRRVLNTANGRQCHCRLHVCVLPWSSWLDGTPPLPPALLCCSFPCAEHAGAPDIHIQLPVTIYHPVPVYMAEVVAPPGWAPQVFAPVEILPSDKYTY